MKTKPRSKKPSPRGILLKRKSAALNLDREVLAWLADVFAAGIPSTPDPSVVSFGEKLVHFPGSALKSEFDCSETPWVREPIECSGDGVTRKDTFVKPVQAGGSSAGEVVLCHRIATQSNGDIQYNWQNDKKADERWLKRIEPILKACSAVMARAPADKNKWCKGLVMFPHLNLTVQGVFTDTNVASDSIRTQINEELHDVAGGWSPGRLGQAYGRLTAYWDSFAFNISNAGYKDDQLHLALRNGTHQLWTVKCPGCRLYHVMHAEWDPKRPELGGLRYDSEGCKRGPGEYDYNKLAPTVRYQMPCGYLVHDDKRERKELSHSGKYSAPTNPGAAITERSFTLEAVSVHYIPFLDLIRQKHEALKALRHGDPEKYCVYVRERECKFWDPNDRPLLATISVNTALKKNREGLRAHPGFRARFFALDRQQGSLQKGDTPHWWMVIRDVAIEDEGTILTQLVFEGKIETDENVIAVLDDHQCDRRFGCADSGDDTRHVYAFCYRHNINAVKGGKSEWYAHEDGARKIFEKERPLHGMTNQNPKFDYQMIGNEAIAHPEEPLFWLYSRKGILDRLAWLRTAPGVKWETPADVSAEYQKSMQSWELRDYTVPSTGQQTKRWEQVYDRDDELFCEAYIAMQMEMAGFVGGEIPPL